MTTRAGWAGAAADAGGAGAEAGAACGGTDAPAASAAVGTAAAAGAVGAGVADAGAAGAAAAADAAGPVDASTVELGSAEVGAPASVSCAAAVGAPGVAGFVAASGEPVGVGALCARASIGVHEALPSSSEISSDISAVRGVCAHARRRRFVIRAPRLSADDRLGPSAESLYQVAEFGSLSTEPRKPSPKQGAPRLRGFTNAFVRLASSAGRSSVSRATIPRSERARDDAVHHCRRERLLNLPASRSGRHHRQEPDGCDGGREQHGTQDVHDALQQRVLIGYLFYLARYDYPPRRGCRP